MAQVFSPARLRVLRLAKGYSQRQLAIAVHRDFFVVGGWERGRDVPNQESMQRLMSLLSCRIEDLYEDSEPVRGIGVGADAGSSRAPGNGAAPASGKSRRKKS